MYLGNCVVPRASKNVQEINVRNWFLSAYVYILTGKKFRAHETSSRRHIPLGELLDCVYKHMYFMQTLAFLAFGARNKVRSEIPGSFTTYQKRRRSITIGISWSVRSASRAARFSASKFRQE